MAIVSEHYENLLADYYSWMCGSAEMKIAENRHFFQSHNVAPELSKNVIDLGAGSGFQSIPLEEVGFQVIAAVIQEVARACPHKCHRLKFLAKEHKPLLQKLIEVGVLLPWE